MLSHQNEQQDLHIPHTFSVDLFSKLNLEFQLHFGSQYKYKKFPYFKIHITVQMKSFYLAFIKKWLICNVMVCQKANNNSRI